MKRYIIATSIILVTFLGLVNCGSKGGDSALSIPDNFYQAGVTAGDGGTFNIDFTCSQNCVASLTVENSSYGLNGKTFNVPYDAHPNNNDVAFNVTGQSNQKIFKFPNYAVLPIKIDYTDPANANFFAKNTYLTQSVFLPVIAIKKSSLIGNHDDLTPNTTSGTTPDLRYGVWKEVAMGRDSTNGQINYTAEARYGNIQPNFQTGGNPYNQSSFQVVTCSNNGSSSGNSNLIDQNCIKTTRVFNFNSNSGPGQYCWKAQAVANSTVITYACFTKDIYPNSIIGYIDSYDTSMNTSSFSIVTITQGWSGDDNPYLGNSSFYSYQFCSNNANCAYDSNGNSGIFFATNLNIAPNHATTITHDFGNGHLCNEVLTPNNPVRGWFTDVWSSLPVTQSNPTPYPCNNPGDRADAIMIFFGRNDATYQSMSAFIGYDTTITNGPSQKLAINYIGY